MVYLICVSTLIRRHDVTYPWKTWLPAIAAWFVAVLGLTVVGAFRGPPDAPPVGIILAVLLPVLAAVLAYRLSPTFRQSVLAFDPRELVALHAWRMVGFGFVLLYLYGTLPGLFALPAGLGDVIAAFGALVIALQLFRGAPVSRARLLAWNVFGLADFVAAVALGVVTRETWLGNQLTSHVMGDFPLVLIPGFIVPFYVLTHLLLFVQLRRGHGYSTALST